MAVPSACSFLNHSERGLFTDNFSFLSVPVIIHPNLYGSLFTPFCSQDNKTDYSLKFFLLAYPGELLYSILWWPS